MISIEARKQKWIDFYDLTSPVNRMISIFCLEGMPERPPVWWEKKQERIDWALRRYERHIINSDLIGDDTVPFMAPATGTEIFAEAFGCKVHKPLDNNPFALPLIETAQQLHTLKMPNLWDTPLVNLFDMADAMRAAMGPDAMLSLPDMQSPMDVASLIWEKTGFYAAMYEEPEAVHHLSSMVKELQFAFFDEWFRRYGKSGLAHYPDYYLPCGITMSEDEIGCVSADMFVEFFAQELADFSERYGAIGIHCCADARHQWQNLKNIPGLILLNLFQPQDVIQESLDFFGDTVAQCPGPPELDGEKLFAADPSYHIAKYTIVQTVEEGRRLVDSLSRWL